MHLAPRLLSLTCAAVLLTPALASAQIGPDASGTVASPSAYDFVTLGDGTGQSAGVECDDCEAEHALPFAFTFYGNDYDYVTVGDNGALRFSSGSGPLSIGYANTELPESGFGAPDIAVFWDDMNSGVSGANVFVYDDPVTGAFIVSWEDIRHYGPSPAGASFQVQLHPDSSIELHYADTTFGDNNDDGASATVGVQDHAGGTEGAGNVLEISFNSASILSGDAWLISAVDEDGDGTPGAADCDDTDPSIYPGAPEVCADGIDQDCNLFDLLTDNDLDGDFGEACGGGDCDDSDPARNSLTDGDGDGFDTCSDCDDADPAVFPGAAELCDGLDSDCDGAVEELTDADGDGASLCDGDCDDDEPAASPAGVELLCDGLDNDCDEATLDLGDADGDGASCDVDCDDADPAVFPFAPELCDDIDSDCDGLADSSDLDVGAVSGLVGADAPAVAFGSVDIETTIDMTGAPGTVSGLTVLVDITHTWVEDTTLILTSPAGTPVLLTSDNGGDGDDYQGTVFDDAAASAITSGTPPYAGRFRPEEPLAILDGEAIDGVWTLAASDVFPTEDDGVLHSWQLIFVAPVHDDADEDGAVDSCGDCDANDDTIFPGAPELCADGIDQDCDGADELADDDGDGEDDALCGGTDCDDGDPAVNSTDGDGDGASTCAGDCDDGEAAVHPDATEVCGDGIDNDCLDGDALTDGDGDGFPSPLCGGDDCDDDDAAAFPGGVDDLCDGIDSDCDGLDLDLDGDGAAGLDCGGGDCDDSDAAAFPGALELCDDSDTDCDGRLDAFDLDIGAGPSGPSVTQLADLFFDDQNRADAEIDMTGDLQIVAGMTVELDISHTFTGDVTATLISPAGTRVVLASGVGDSGDDFTGTLFTDAAGLPIFFGLPPFTGAFAPQEPLALLDGEPVDGVWTLELIDCCANDFGTLDSWTLTFSGGTVDDADGDGAVDSCGDCDDGDLFVFPGAPELCGDSIDQDCDGVDNELDADGDGFPNAACGPAPDADCDDDAPFVNPGAHEVCNDGIDQNCNADPDGVNPDDLFDDDGDGSPCDVDCDDSEPLAAPGFPEVCDDGIDNNCDSVIDTGDLDGDGVDCSLDCDDTNPGVFPGAPEVLCDGIDNDCDVTPDIDDGDGDSFDCDEDCDDSEATTNPDAVELGCDGIDNDCNGEIDPDDDVDDDGALCDVDCDDLDPARSPDLAELCDDAIDNDCDPATDDDQDADGDGSNCIDDCDDVDPLTFPGAPEICADSIDQDCDGAVDELAADFYELGDGDSVLIGLCTFSVELCGVEYDAVYVNDDGILSFAGPVAGEEASIAAFGESAPLIAGLWTDLDPGTDGSVEITEIDGSSLEIAWRGVPLADDAEAVSSFTMLLDADGGASLHYGAVGGSSGVVGFSCDSSLDAVDFTDDDPEGLGHFGRGTGGVVQAFDELEPLSGLVHEAVELCLTTDSLDEDGDSWTAACGDCDDSDGSSFPGAEELCDGADNDCDGSADNVDADADGFVDADCDGDDCDDASELTNPDATELCDGLDNDCDGAIEDGGADADGDGYRVCDEDGADCDDEDAAINPGADELCDGVDNNCDGALDDGFEPDADADGYAAEDCGGDDCDDDDAGSNPGATEIPYDGVDNDCDGVEIDDVDGDGEPGLAAGGTDCDDEDPAVFAGATEVCDDEVDNNCDELSDGDDDECGACADCASSLSASPQGTGLFGLLLALGFAGRRRRS